MNTNICNDLISVIIPNFNGEKYISNCLNCLYSQDYINFEIIVVDNNSSDLSMQILEQYNKINLIKLDKNYGFAYAVNIGIKASRGDYVALLNNDTEVQPNWLSELYKSVIDDNVFSCSSLMIRMNDKNLVDDAGDSYTLLGWGYKNGDGKPVSSFSEDADVFSSCAGAAIYKKDILEKIGLFDETFFAYLEDIDVSYRGNLHGYKNKLAVNAKVYHVGSATSGSKYNKFKVWHSSRNNIYLIYKNMPFLIFLLNLPFLFTGYIIKLLFFCYKGYGKDYLLGTFEGVKGLKNIKKFKSSKWYYHAIIEYKLFLLTIKYVISRFI